MEVEQGVQGHIANPGQRQDFDREHHGIQAKTCFSEVCKDKGQQGHAQPTGRHQPSGPHAQRPGRVALTPLLGE